MKNNNLLIICSVLILACTSESQRNFELGTLNFKNGRHIEAVPYFVKIDDGDPNYQEAQRYLDKIDSIRIIKKNKRDRQEARLEYETHFTSIKSHLEKEAVLRDKETWATIDELISDFLYIETAAKDLQKINGNPEAEELQKLIEELRSKLPKTQTIVLPKMRKKYGEILAKQLWRENIEVNVKGSQNKTIEFIGGFFASNANIEDTQKEVLVFLQNLRFTRSEYKWRESPVDYTYYSINSKKDSEI